MTVLIDNRQHRQYTAIENAHDLSQRILDALEYPDAELSVVIVDDDEIAALNKRYLNRNGPTNVIAFPMNEGECSNINPAGLLGDVVISADTAQKEADDAGISADERFVQLLVHGILHLVGYDHEQSEEQADQMERKSNELLEHLRRLGYV